MSAPEQLRWIVPVPENADEELQTLSAVQWLLGRIGHDEALRVINFVKDKWEKV